GPNVDRIYPRDARTVLAGSTVTVVGRLRGEAPKRIGLRYRKGDKLVEEQRNVDVVPTPAFGDVAKRWAEERVEESVTHADGIEPAIALAAKARLLTPWTGWFWSSMASSRNWDDRILGLSATIDTAFASKVEPAPPPPSLLLEPPQTFDGEA